MDANKKSPHPSALPFPSLHLSALCLYIGRVIEGAVTGSRRLKLPLPGTLLVSIGKKKKNKVWILGGAEC